jgi:hypothetical protein
MVSKFWHGWILLILGLLLTGCASLSSTPESTLETAFPSEISGWTSTEDVRLFDSENLFDLVDGQADAFFVYGFEQVAVRTYTNPAGDRLDVQIWQLATPADAYGLFTLGRAGSPATIGNEGDAESGRRLSFWQDRYTVHVGARQDVDDALLWDFARFVSDALPQGGEPPSIIIWLPQNELDGFREHGFIFFHEELSIQDRIWLGGENILGLSHDTNGVVATYEVDDTWYYLLLVEYPTANQASARQQALQTEQVDDLLTIQVRDNMLIAVFGTGDKTRAETLMAEVLTKVD